MCIWIYADSLLHFSLKRDGEIAALDNGNETDLTSFGNKESCKAFNGLGLAIVKVHHQKDELVLFASVEGLQGANVIIQTN